MSLINPKCAAVSGVAVLLYHTFPTRDMGNSLLNTALLAGGVYVGLAWYDSMFDCEQKSKASEWFTIYRPFKPPIGQDGTYGG